MADLDVGQSFFVPTASPEDAHKMRSRLASAVYLFEKQTSGQRQFTLRTTSDGVRVWRVAYPDIGASLEIIYDRPDIAANPKQIAKIEICCLDDARAKVRIYSGLNAGPEVFEFPDKASAIDFYRDVWRFRSAIPDSDGSRPIGTQSPAQSPHTRPGTVGLRLRYGGPK